MASADRNKFTFTYQQATVWREQLFDNRSLRISVGELSKWPLGPYLWAAVLQAAHLKTHSYRSVGKGEATEFVFLGR